MENLPLKEYILIKLPKKIRKLPKPTVSRIPSISFIEVNLILEEYVSKSKNDIHLTNNI
jgi:hypothetical protein